MIFFYLLLTLLGLSAGSFLGVVAYRLPRGLSITGRSFCDNCKRKLLWSENIPLISFLLLDGKCKSCKNKIPLRYPLFEIATALLFVLTFIFWQNLTPVNGIAFIFKENLGVFSLFTFYFLLFTFLALFTIDLERKILPDGLIYFAGVVVIFLVFTLPSPLLFEHLLVGSLSSSFFLLLYLITRGRGMGFGDVKLAFWLGLLLGYPEGLVWIFLSFLIGALVGVFLIILGFASLRKPVAFGPFLLIAALIAFSFGQSLFKLYLNITW